MTMRNLFAEKLDSSNFGLQIVNQVELLVDLRAICEQIV